MVCLKARSWGPFCFFYILMTCHGFFGELILSCMLMILIYLLLIKRKRHFNIKFVMQQLEL